MRRFPSRRQDLTVAQQYAALQSSNLRGSKGSLQKGKLQWDFDAQATPLGRVYRARVDYRLGTQPRVTILYPSLKVLAGGRSLPHVYEQDPPRLCLYLPGTGEWSPSKLIAVTIIPWIFLWLFYFEDWLATDDWKGGGMHPTDKGDDYA